MKQVTSLLACIVIFLFSSTTNAQDKPITEGGKLMLGMRSTVSAFSDEGNGGMGVGGQFRLRLLKQLNTEWFADYITSDIDGLARRKDAHIGWSVMFYALNQDVPKKLNPYFLGGHCFDYTKVSKNFAPEAQSRWSSAVHMGLGTHFNLTKRADLSLSSQYMIHLGKDIAAEKFTGPTGEQDVKVVKEDLGLEGHLFVTLSVNILVADLW